MGLSAQQLSQPLRLGHLRGDPRRLLRCLERPHGKIQRHHLNRNQKMGTGHDLRRLVLETGCAWVVGREVSAQPPWSIETSTITAPGFIAATVPSEMSLGAVAPATK